ncbi:MAG: rod shape-determining protein RodA [Planctomycetes bacterium]|nr:rod shape-determining protein RodA [Planctomycetota bacterium]
MKEREEPESGGGSLSSFFSPARAFSLREVRWFELDWHVLLIALGLLALGLVFVRAIADADLAAGRSGFSFARHFQKLVLTLPAVLLALAVRPRWLRRNAWTIYGVCLALLAVVMFVGGSRNGSQRWIPLPVGFDLQPSELAKLGVIVMLARVLYRNRLERARDWAPPIAIALLPMGLVALQPDLGTALSIVPITLGMLFVAGARASVLLRFLVGAAIVAVCVWQFQIGVHDYQLQRVHTWIDGFRAQDLIDARGGPAFHSYHARVAIGNGGLFGQGLGAGVANQTGYLPERDCDSIFAVVAEELGLAGTLGLLGAYGLMIALMMGSASAIRDRFSRLAAGGVACYFGAQLFINVGVNLGLIPMTGITLPLFSTGGSSMLVTFLALGLFLGLSSHHEPSLDRDSFRT